MVNALPSCLAVILNNVVCVLAVHHCDLLHYWADVCEIFIGESGIGQCPRVVFGDDERVPMRHRGASEEREAVFGLVYLEAR